MEKPEWFISTTLIGTNLAIIAGSTLATGLLIGIFGPTARRTNFFLRYAADAFYDDHGSPDFSALCRNNGGQSGCFYPRFFHNILSAGFYYCR